MGFIPLLQKIREPGSEGQKGREKARKESRGEVGWVDIVRKKWRKRVKHRI